MELKSEEGQTPTTPDTPQNTEPEQAAAAETLGKINERFWQEINEANVVLEWAVSSGKDIPKDIVSQIKKGQTLLVGVKINHSDRAEFEYTYSQLAKLVTPVTFITLKATSDKYGRESCLAPVHFIMNMYNRTLKPGFQRLWSLFRPRMGREEDSKDEQFIYISRARVWSRMLWIWTLVFLILILFGEHLQGYLNTYPASVTAPSNTEGSRNMQWERLTYWLQKFSPFCYGALGACAYLLRSCHKHIHERTFDPRRLPEYYNRLLLGLLSGGAILLYLKPGEGAVTVGATGLAFLAGYSTDFFFTYIERIIEAITPKSPSTSPSLSTPSAALSPPPSTPPASGISGGSTH